MSRRGLLGLAWATLFVACARRDPSTTREPGPEDSERLAQAPSCFDVVAKDNSAATRTVFAAKRCQGGGVTWAGILGILTDRRGESKPAEAPTPGWTGDVRILSWDGRPTRIAIDDEGDAARFCADSERLVSDIRADIKRLNADPAELERAMGAADPLALECLPDGTSLETLLKGMTPPPPPSPAEARARETSRARLRAALAKQRTWCWGKGGAAFGGKGGLTLHADGKATEFGNVDQARDGRWTLRDDGRIEVIVPGGHHHFDVGESGRLGFDHSGGREELDACEPPVSPK